MTMAKLGQCCFVLMAIMCASLLIIGLVILGLSSYVGPYLLTKLLPIQPSSETYPIWKNPPVPMSLSVYLFNLTNSEDVKNGATPEVEEVGPYVYREVHESTNITWNSNDTVKFMMKRSWYFSPEKSRGTEDDLITTFNVPLLAAASMAERQPILIEMLLIGIIEGVKEPLFTTRPVREWLFQGMDDPLLKEASKFQKLINKTFMPFDKFGWFYQRNNSEKADGIFNMFTGVNHLHKLGEVERWNGENATHYYEPPCNTVNGSAGQFFPPQESKTYVSFFVSDVCRTLTIPFGTSWHKDGLTTYRYVGGKELLANSTDNPNNQCFSKHSRPSGVADVSKCKFNIPAYVSYPHFYLADVSYRANVIGMYPSMKKHSMFIDLEPVTGTPLQVSAKLQVNIQIQPVLKLHKMRKLPEVLMPFIWFHEHVMITEDLKSSVRWLVRVPDIAMALGISLSTISLSVLGIYFVFWIVMRKKNRIAQQQADEDRLIPSNQDTEETEHKSTGGD